MNGWLIGAVALVGVVVMAIAQRRGWIDLAAKNRGSGSHGGLAGIGDEVFHPTRYETQLELDRQTVLPAPAPVAGDGDKGIYGGSVRITLDEDDETR